MVEFVVGKPHKKRHISKKDKNTKSCTDVIS